METRFHTATITIYDRNAAFDKIQNLLHEFGKHIVLRVGYPICDSNCAIIFLILKMSNDRLGALSGKIGQLHDVSIKSNSLDIKEQI